MQSPTVQRCRLMWAVSSLRIFLLRCSLHISLSILFFFSLFTLVRPLRHPLLLYLDNIWERFSLFNPFFLYYLKKNKNDLEIKSDFADSVILKIKKYHFIIIRIILIRNMYCHYCLVMAFKCASFSLSLFLLSSSPFSILIFLFFIFS